MAILIFTCPATRMKVQHWLEGGRDIQENQYESVICKACTRLHFINRKTGKLLGYPDSPERDTLGSVVKGC
jgi:hypothetical protein